MAETISNLIPRAKDTSAVANVIAINADGPGYYDSQAVMVKVANTTTGATTLSISGRTAIPVKKANDAALVAGDIEAGQWCLFIYNSDDNTFEMLSQIAIQPGSGGDATANIGYLNIPQNSQSADYTAVLSDSGKCIFHPVADNNARTFTIPANASVAYPIGTVLVFKNNAAANLSIAITSDTLTLDGAGTTGTRTLAQYGKATAMKETATTWSIGGVNLS